MTDAQPPVAPQSVFTLGVPVLGICYGMQTMAHQLGGRVAASTEREFGYAEVTVRERVPTARRHWRSSRFQWLRGAGCLDESRRPRRLVT